MILLFSHRNHGKYTKVLSKEKSKIFADDYILGGYKTA
jgi:hypothetical protein